jgi:hypothetical protein
MGSRPVTTLSLRPRVAREQALDRLGALGRWPVVGPGPLRRVADVYVPFHLYKVGVRSGASAGTSWLALDAVSGALDPYEFDRPPDEAELVRIQTRNRPEPALSDAEAAQLVRDKVRRVVFQTGFFRLRGALQLDLERQPLELHMPYWLGFYGAEERLRLRVLDAVRGRVEGNKARALFEAWLRDARAA